MLTTTEDAFIINNDNESWDGGSTEIMDVYRDFAGIPDDTAVESGDVESILLSKYQPSFPVRLQHMLGQLEEEGYEDIASWEIHGRCFKIYDQQRFEKEVLPRFFNQKKYSSFQRQLNLYDFKRLSVGRDRGAYYHEKFLKGKPGLASQIKRIKKKGTGPRKPANPDTEPNFYQMPPLTKGGMHDINIGTDSDCILSHVVSLPEYDLHYGTDDDDDEVLSAPSAPEPDGTTSGSGRKTVLLDAFNASPRSIVSGVNLSAFLDELLLLSKTNDGQNDDDGAEIYAMA